MTDETVKCPKCGGPMENGIHQSEFSPCVIGDDADNTADAPDFDREEPGQIDGCDLVRFERG